MEYAKYYNVSNLVETMQKAGEINEYPTGNNSFKGVYVCMDTNDFWISRIVEGYNEEYEKEEGKYLVERNKLDIYNVMDKLHELYSKVLPDFKNSDKQFEMKNKCHNYFKKYKTESICRAVILLDNEDGLTNWDCCEADSLEEAIEIIDGGYGILPLVA